jgi:hypothetical protein
VRRWRRLGCGSVEFDLTSTEHSDSHADAHTYADAESHACTESNARSTHHHAAAGEPDCHGRLRGHLQCLRHGFVALISVAKKWHRDYRRDRRVVHDSGCRYG